MNIASRECASCHLRYDVLITPKGIINLDTDIDDPVCPNCRSAEFHRLVLAGTGVQLGGAAGVGKHYPYFDRALNMEITSAQHRRQVCKEKGLVPVDGDVDLESDVKAEHARMAEGAARHKEYTERLESDPQYADYRRLRDKGFYGRSLKGNSPGGI